MDFCLDAKHFTALFLIVSFAKEITASSCSDHDAAVCSSAVSGGNLDSLKSHGLCQRRPYGTEFTHVCSVMNYEPSVDHCCCDLDPGALCCTYQQNWNHFRCSLTKDKVASSESQDGVALYIILPVCLVASLILSVIIYCCAKRWCLEQDKKRGTGCCGGSRTEKNKVDLEEEDRDQLSPLRDRGTHNSGDSLRLNSRHNSAESDVQPSAPSEDEFGHVCVTFTAGESGVEQMRRSHSQPYPATVQHPDFTRSISANPPIGGTCPSCASITPVAPPTYDESHTHQVIQ